MDSKGQSLVEVVVAIGLLVLGMAAIGFLVIDSAELSTRYRDDSKAIHLAQEGVEAVRSIRDNNFSSLENGTYGIEINNETWELEDSPQQIDGYRRTIEISDKETDIKEIKVLVEWNLSESSISSTSLITLMSNWKEEVEQGQGQDQGQGNN